MENPAFEIVNQLITLSTGIIGLSLIFLKEVADRKIDKKKLLISWIIYLLSIVMGLYFYSDIAFNEKFNGLEPDKMSYFFVILQFGFFITATLMLIVVKWKSIKDK